MLIGRKNTILIQEKLKRLKEIEASIDGLKSEAGTIKKELESIVPVCKEELANNVRKKLAHKGFGICTRCNKLKPHSAINKSLVSTIEHPYDDIFSPALYVSEWTIRNAALVNACGSKTVSICYELHALCNECGTELSRELPEEFKPYQKLLHCKKPCVHSLSEEPQLGSLPDCTDLRQRFWMTDEIAQFLDTKEHELLFLAQRQYI